jgi:2-succinyl-5-enolpyruvyl-6-hydroxy-3-cyclohexene-1-carboxylate synthase
VESADKLEAAITESLARPGVDLIELPVNRQESIGRLQQLWAAAARLELDYSKTRSPDENQT